MQDEHIDHYKKELNSSIFSCMELGKQQYSSIILMPVKKFYDYLKWKSDLEEEKSKLMNENS